MNVMLMCYVICLTFRIEKNDIKSPFARHAPYCGVGLGDNLGLENYSTQMSEWQGKVTLITLSPTHYIVITHCFL